MTPLEWTVTLVGLAMMAWIVWYFWLYNEEQ